ncbi:MAG TPA: sulfite exporter TauE/SafE family protein [Acidobacteriota bacterium]|nr:sulfite exporter TauE/SafE family protein [Acidobacteriota bacterium]
MIELTAAVLGATLLGSPHCAGMCGGFACFVAGDAAGARRVLAQAAYNLGRLVSYAVLGLLAGSVGRGVEEIGAAAGVSRAAPIAAGIVLVLWGGANFLRAIGVGAGRARSAAPSPAGAFLARLLRRIGRWPAAARAATVGLVTTLIPCGFLYGFVGVAAGTGSPFAGAAVMAVFWAGTLPVMATVGLIAQSAFGRWRGRLPVVTAALLIVFGLLTIAGRLGSFGGHAHHAAPNPLGAAAAPGGSATHGAAHAGH